MEEVKKELGAYLYEKELLKEKEEDLDELITRATKITTEISDMPKGSPTIQDRMAEYAAEIAQMRDEKIAQLISMYKTKRNIENKIDQLDQPYKNILYFKYIKGLSLSAVAQKIGYDEDYIKSLHGIALVKYKNITPFLTESHL